MKRLAFPFALTVLLCNLLIPVSRSAEREKGIEH
jgi:hypothetical protein